MTPERRVNDERLNEINAHLDEQDAQLLTLHAAVNAIAAAQRPSALMRFFSSTPVILFVITSAVTGAVTTIRLVFSVLGQADQLAIARNTVVPNAWANFEVLAAAADQTCVVAAKPHGASCTRLQLKPPDMMRSSGSSYSALGAIPHLRRTP